MTLREVADKLHLAVQCGEDKLDQVVKGGIVGDLLSDVIANSNASQVWITMQVHVNVVAVAVLKDLAGIIIVQGRKPAEETLKKAQQENVAILVSDRSAFETAGKLYELLGGST